ncbi:sugar-transfer associated ATP-grasp domain-containing protein [Psychrobacillus sp. FJAT-51614]|uniref:Sugar-transfer associated ATP-grasp domain-containing protein n=1 Tax=Psychrobacillus mangrovi TaxID=3117745 RepID=A0ABU8F1A2_9BACI
MKLKSRILQIYRGIKMNRTFILKQRKSSVPTDLKNNIKLARKGFLGESKTIYNFSKNEMKYYLSDIQRLRTRYINAPYSFILDEKVVFESMYKSRLKIPQSFSLIKKGKLIPLHQEYKMENINDLIRYLDSNEKCVIKPIRNGGGYGIHILSKIDNDYYVNSKRVTFNEISRIVEALDDYFVSEFITQGKFGASLYSETTNTIRIVTMIDPATNKAFIPIAVQRIGNKDSSPTDNWTQGGLSAEIDLETGTLGKGVTYPREGILTYHDYHPETQSKISNAVIPHWDIIKKEILEAANLYPYISYIGWDVVTTDEGYMVLEGNNFTDVNLLQVHKPLLKDERVVAFYKTHGIIK